MSKKEEVKENCHSKDCPNDAEYDHPASLCLGCWNAWWNHHIADPDAALAAVLEGDRSEDEDLNIETQGVVIGWCIP